MSRCLITRKLRRNGRQSIVQEHARERLGSRNRQQRWLVPGLLLCAFFICCVLGVLQMWQRSAAEVLYEKVVENVVPGTTLVKIQQKLGSGTILSADQVAGWVTADMADRPEMYPDGFETTDQFLRYYVVNPQGTNDQWYFQFRGGKLVNHNSTLYPETYAQLQSSIVGLSK